MHSIDADAREFRKRLADGSVQRAYRAIMSFMSRLRAHLAGAHAELAVTGLYQGYLDMTYFAVVSPALKSRGLKVAIVFNYDAFRLEAWLAGANRKVQRQYWELVRDAQWTKYRVVAPSPGVDAIVECDLVCDFDLGDADDLTARIESDLVAFLDDVESFLARHPLPSSAT